MAAAYGAYELKLRTNYHLSIGFSFGIGIILLFSGTMAVIHHVSILDPPPYKPPIVIDGTGVWIPPIGNRSKPRVDIRQTAVRPRDGVPVPVPDKLVDPNQTIPEQDDPLRDAGKIGPTDSDGRDIAIDPTTIREPAPDPVPWESIQQDPRVIRSVIPLYPESARRIGLEGRVVVKVLVGKNGRVLQAVVTFSDAEIFNQPALDAIGRFVFSPAITNSGPVQTWVAVPFNFQIR